jgi:hypothetical protein
MAAPLTVVIAVDDDAGILKSVARIYYDDSAGLQLRNSERAESPAADFAAQPCYGLKANALKHRDVFQQRDHAQNDDDDARDLLGATIER